MARLQRKARRASATGAPRVVVVGMGFGGLATVKQLTRAGMRVTLVDRNIYSTFQPLLYQVATGGLNPSDVAYPLRGFAHRYGARFRRGELVHIDDAVRKITLSHGEKLDYDYLILAIGITAAYYGITGADKHGLAMYTRRDAVALRDQILAWLERLSEEDQGRCLAITIVGGGATGVELAGTLAELRNIALPTAYPDIDRSRMRIRLVEQAPVLLAPYNPSLREYAHRQLLNRGVDVRLDTKIREITADHVVLAGGDHLPSDLTVWAAGVMAPDSLGGWGLPQGRGGRIRVGPAGKPTARFEYHDKGIMATIGRRSAVVQLRYGMRIRGTLAWFAWLALHLVTLLGNRNRISTLINLAYRYLTWGRGGALLVDSDPPAN